jgi:hypothetical protein
MKTYQIKSISEKAIVEEIHDGFNEGAFEDDSFMIPDHLHAYVQLNETFYRTIKSPFFLSDVLNSGSLSEKKKHKLVGPLKLFCLQKEVLYVDRWSLQFDNQKKVKNLDYSLSGDYKFFIESPANFLKHFVPFFGPLQSVHLVQFSTKFNHLIQQDLLAILFTFTSISEADGQRIQMEMLQKLNTRFSKVGIKIHTFTVNISK